MSIPKSKSGRKAHSSPKPAVNYCSNLFNLISNAQDFRPSMFLISREFCPEAGPFQLIHHNRFYKLRNTQILHEDQSSNGKTTVNLGHEVISASS